ncbi:hypothetical protein MKY84_05810 [Chryseomicrobium sp. FSL W7-1435]|uniref:hypothetical protein n=1 Tax=Chryseomicrobium sp. FSL W7-1435 TaxID=2921704 RepID=UPI00315A3CF3
MNANSILATRPMDQLYVSGLKKRFLETLKEESMIFSSHAPNRVQAVIQAVFDLMNQERVVEASKSEIAERAGLTLYFASQILKQLENEGYVLLRRGIMVLQFK